MMNKKEKDQKKTEEIKQNQNAEKKQELDLDDLEKVSGGGAFSDIPRVPNKDYDETVTENI